MGVHKLLFFSATIFLSHLSYLAIFFGVAFISEVYLKNLSTLVQLGVCLFLIYRFFPLKEIDVLTKLDRSIIFYCATFLLLNVVLVELYNSFWTPLIVSLNIS
jgi:hypothetical protein